MDSEKTIVKYKSSDKELSFDLKTDKENSRLARDKKEAKERVLKIGGVACEVIDLIFDIIEIFAALK